MSFTIPKKLANYSKDAISVQSMVDITPTFTRLVPMNSSSTTTYTSAANNRITFRIPSFQNTFMDNSRSFISYKYTNTTAGLPAVGTARTQNSKKADWSGSVFNSITVRSSNGVIIQQTDNAHVLSKLFKLMDVREETALSCEGDYSYATSAADKLLVANSQETTKTYTMKMDYGVFSQYLKSYLPLHLLGTTFALDLELHLSPPEECMEITNAFAGLTPSYSLTDVAFNLALLEVSPEICKKFDQVACDENDAVIIPFQTYSNHTSTQNSQSQVHFISEAATSLSAVYVAILENQQTFADRSIPLKFLGGANTTTENERLESYQLQVGNRHIYNEPVLSLSTDNNESMQHLKNSLYNQRYPMFVEKRAPGTVLSRYESGSNFMIGSTMTFSEESNHNTDQGISTGGLPLKLSIKMRAGGQNLTVQSFCKLGYNLVIKRGQANYVEINDFSRKSY